MYIELIQTFINCVHHPTNSVKYNGSQSDALLGKKQCNFECSNILKHFDGFYPGLQRIHANLVLQFQGSFALIVSSVESVMSECDSDNRDCSCADRSYKECQEPNTGDNFHVNNLEECIFQCDVSTSLLETSQSSNEFEHFSSSPHLMLVTGFVLTKATVSMTTNHISDT